MTDLSRLRALCKKNSKCKKWSFKETTGNCKITKLLSLHIRKEKVNVQKKETCKQEKKNVRKKIKI
jgi:hypothetical protein